MLISFSRLKPKEQNANSGYRDLSGYYRKHENSQDNNSPRMLRFTTSLQNEQRAKKFMSHFKA